MENVKSYMEPAGKLSCVKVTIFTPTFNRRHTLERAYRSLQKQTFKKFEWLIIDDGSTDDTESLITIWQKEENFFPIRYQWKTNGGKHTAHNLAISLAWGEYFAILDSDDWYAPEALAILTAEWNGIPEENRKQFANIEGLCRYEDDALVGQPYPADIYDSDYITIQTLIKRPADTMGMYRLEVLKEFPFPDCFDGRFVQEGLVWNRIAKKYRIRFLNKTTGYKEYLKEGLTRRSLRAVFTKSEPMVLYCREMSRIKSLPLIKRLKCKANVYRYSFHNKLSILKQVKEESSRLMSMPFIVIGYLVYIKDKINLFKEEFTKPSS